ncbi:MULTISPECIES: diaminopimelate epimerase [unclassified Croceitalea]|uniref:diaminopimelate epimerase n=1 Tax=unclassified Croceitalea TaxID=2632280 RepID=UPI0030D78EC2
MQLIFYKYQGTGNDFVLVDNRQQIFPKNNTKLIAFLCDRKFGIGADGLILLENDELSDFKMVYYNSDGNESSMCGNGGRCIVAFAKKMGVIENATTFNAIDGIHKAIIEGDVVTLQMIDVDDIKAKSKYLFLDTGSPHHVQFVEGLNELDVVKEGAKLRYGIYGQAGCNINFVKAVNSNTFEIRTYERGVEDETLSCGTGVTAVALAMHHTGKANDNHIYIHTKGGKLEVTFDHENGVYTNVNLIGKANFVFKGEISC